MMEIFRGRVCMYVGELAFPEMFLWESSEVSWNVGGRHSRWSRRRSQGSLS